MNLNSRIIMIACMVLLLTAGCRKPNNSRTTDINTGPISTGGQPPTFPGGTQPSLNQLFKELRYTPEVKCVTAGILQVVTFSKGTRLTFYPNSFKNAAGATITSGTVCIEMIEMYKPGDMIANGATTATTDGGLLRSGGQVYINATMDGQKVFTNKYGIAFRQSATNTQRMDIYYGSTSNKDSLAQWTVGDTTLTGTIALGAIIDSAPTTPPFPPPPVNPYYIFDSCTDVNWINADRLIGFDGPKTKLTIPVSDVSFNRNNTRAFVVFTDFNGVMSPGYNTSSDPLTPAGFVLNFIPEGVHFTVVLVSIKDGNYYYFEQTGLTVTTNISVPVTMEQHTRDYVTTKLSAL